ncbi:hypothetical protein B9Z19DRAFT_1087706 [Tuber borchii]|uniref:Uncharacterized protein n=1 Tax=Tuber borchii TaxID=42251 RepID=A0A2T6ZMI3_TUBBO|nr:hypothetical protein B9Z19DRAFT_1087706 [Tuber borchii]
MISFFVLQLNISLPFCHLCVALFFRLLLFPTTFALFPFDLFSLPCFWPLLWSAMFSSAWRSVAFVFFLFCYFSVIVGLSVYLLACAQE